METEKSAIQHVHFSEVAREKDRAMGNLPFYLIFLKNIKQIHKALKFIYED